MARNNYEIQKRWREKNKAKRKENDAKYYQANCERLREYALKKYYERRGAEMPRPKLTDEEKKQRRRDFSYRHFEQKRARGGKKTGRIGEKLKPEDKTPPPKIKIVYVAWVIPLVGDPIQVGPFKSKHVTLKARYRIVKKLVAEKNAKDSDIRLLGMYEKGLLEDSD